MPNVHDIKERATFNIDRVWNHWVEFIFNKLIAKQGGDVTWLLTLSDTFPSLGEFSKTYY